VRESVQSIPWLVQAAFSDFSGGVTDATIAIAAALVVGKFLHFWPYLWNKSWNGAPVLFLALIGGGTVGLSALLICGTFRSESYIQSWFKRTEKELASDPGWRRTGFTEVARKLWEPTQPTIDEGVIRLDLKNSADWELLVNSQHQAAKSALEVPPYKASFVAETTEIQIPLPSLTPPVSYPVTVGPDNLWTGDILKSAIATVQKEAMETGLEHATKTRMISSVAILCLIPMIMIGLAIAADRDIAVH
jgi:hypothetical protein